VVLVVLGHLESQFDRLVQQALVFLESLALRVRLEVLGAPEHLVVLLILVARLVLEVLEHLAGQ
jgi:hypothetical protein